jgi:glycosyltransferase involved in cell wall biosynthesis
VLSDIRPHRESLADAALYFGPGDAHALAQKLRCVLEDHALRRSLSRRAQGRVAPLSWDAAAQRIRELLREITRAS